MLELAMMSDKLSDDFMDKIDDLDKDRDGEISNAEIAGASQNALDAIRDMAQSKAEWDMVREVALIKGEYKSIVDGMTKGMDPGEGGRFRVLVDSLVDRGYPVPAAKAIAVKVGQAKYAWMR
jgi:hypothetical protein